MDQTPSAMTQSHTLANRALDSEDVQELRRIAMQFHVLVCKQDSEMRDMRAKLGKARTAIEVGR